MALALVYPLPSDEGDSLPFFAESVAAGFPSPAAGYEANELNQPAEISKLPQIDALRAKGIPLWILIILSATARSQ
ncbi:hypothetical protein [Photorhabdus laumondii]|uniref:hypothetical protein n=1 Tax=Photorhabdus laumondii TaxID=2218628 RepID=UPI001F4E9627|nr:hypothetical protein [Photorhabdus laumondii]